MSRGILTRNTVLRLPIRIEFRAARVALWCSRLCISPARTYAWPFNRALYSDERIDLINGANRPLFARHSMAKHTHSVFRCSFRPIAFSNITITTSAFACWRHWRWPSVGDTVTTRSVSTPDRVAGSREDFQRFRDVWSRLASCVIRLADIYAHARSEFTQNDALISRNRMFQGSDNARDECPIGGWTVALTEGDTAPVVTKRLSWGSAPKPHRCAFPKPTTRSACSRRDRRIRRCERDAPGH